MIEIAKKVKIEIGDKVASVSGCFIEGNVEDINMENGNEILTIRWTKHNTQGNIDFVQKRSSSIVNKLNIT